MRTSFVDKEHRAVADLVWVRPGEYLLTRINVPIVHRRKGIATRLMQQIIAEADETNSTLVIEVAPSGGMNYDQLVRWYTRLGFTKAHRIVMVRKPNTGGTH